MARRAFRPYVLAGAGCAITFAIWPRSRTAFAQSRAPMFAGSASPPSHFELGYVTDVEGNFDYWQRYVARSRVLKYVRPGLLDLAHEGAHFVFGGDVVDKGIGDIRMSRELVDLKRRYPDRVWLLVGNRDLNKLRLSAELSPADIARAPEDIPGPHWDTKALTFSRHVDQVVAKMGGGVTRADVNTRAERLRWMLVHTLGCPNTFELRRQEVALLQGLLVERVSDDNVVDSFLSEVKPGGSLWEYLEVADIAVVVGNTLFVHGAVTSSNMGFVPALSSRFELPREPQPGQSLSAEGVHCWVAALNTFLRQGLDDHLRRPEWDESRQTRGGEQLVALQNRAAMWGRSVISCCYADGGVITDEIAVARGRSKMREANEKMDALIFEGVCDDPRDPVVADWLLKSGVHRVVVGHKPSGDSPAILSAKYTGVEVVSADTSFADYNPADPEADPRGCAITEVVLQGSPDVNQMVIHGVLRDGKPYETRLPMLPRTAVPEESGDTKIGTAIGDGWWVKARLLEEDKYLLCRGKGRHVEYRYADADTEDFRAARL